MKADKVDLTPKSLSKLKIMIQYEIKPLRDEIIKQRKENKALERKVDYLNGKLMFNEVK